MPAWRAENGGIGYIHSKGLIALCTLGVAKDSHASIGTRATAAKDMVSDKLDENRHAVSPSSGSSPCPP